MRFSFFQANISRRGFFRQTALAGIGAALSGWLPSLVKAGIPVKPEKPATNIKDALDHARTELSMPGKYPGRVVEVYEESCLMDRKPVQKAVDKMVKTGMLTLTGEKSVKAAWRTFISPKDRVGIKVNPVAGKELSTSIEITRAIISQLREAGVPAGNIVIWDRRLFELEETGFTAENFPGIRIDGTELKDASGSFYDSDGKLYSEKMIDRNWYYWADVEGTYDAETMPYMVNGGKYSYFTKICTSDVDKIINVPILKNAGASVTLCMKNLAYGAISNTGRLHKDLWSETTAQVCAFPPLRDKVVLNIVDGMIGCYQGGPAANAQYITNFNLMLFGTDPVAVDRMGYEIIYKKRVAEGIQKEETARGREFMKLASDLGLGVEEITKIDYVRV
jgi:uncharacterized protein (DUF362 family)